MSASRCSKLAGLGALSALLVLRRRRSRYGPGYLSEGFERVDSASERCAFVGGLKEESRMRSVFGAEIGFAAGRVCTIRKACEECVKLDTVWFN